jgi:hypothetical protein
MKRLLLAVVLVVLLSTAIVTIAFAATTHLFSQNVTAQSIPSGVSVQPYVGSDANLAPGANNGFVSDHAQGDCPFHSGAASQDSSPSY